MLSLRHILLPTDFSRRSVVAARHAAPLAKHFHSKITLLHVAQVVRLSPGDVQVKRIVVEETLAEHQKQVRAQLHSFLAEELAEFEVNRVLAEGDPAGKIVEYAHSENVDLIMMPTRGWGTFRRFILGSVTAKVLHDVRCPVWTGVHIEEPAEEAAPPVRTVLCAIDLASNVSEHLRWASWFAKEFDAELVIVHAIPSFEFTPETVYLQSELLRLMSSEAKEKVVKMLGECAPPGIQIQQVLAGGSVSKVVRTAAENHGAGLVVIGRASAAGLLGRLRTDAYAIIRDSPCPVISV
ncbi:MAG TPA: universal stress protein [Bryobacterales bacterium]|jgi:nucleotide-binding universal stress UspA family protein|nr:universal stress protein [Bryobacterales bacterium]